MSEALVLDVLPKVDVVRLPVTSPELVAPSDGPADTSIRASFLWGPYVLEVFSATDRASFERLYRQRLVAHLRDQKALVPQGFDEFVLPGFCVVCQKPTMFKTADLAFESSADGHLEPAWRERQVCTCDLNCRERSSYHVLSQIPGISSDAKIYCTERGPLFTHVRKAFPNAIASEHLGDQVPLGARNAEGVRNEDITRLTFADGSIDCILSLSTLEKVIDVDAALRETARCLKPGGLLMLPVPFRFDENGLRSKGEFGWDLLGSLREAGFAEAEMVVFTAPQYGYAGIQFIILANRGASVENPVSTPRPSEPAEALESGKVQIASKAEPTFVPAVLVISQEEQGLGFLEVLRDKLEDKYPNGQILCLVRKDNYSPAFTELKAKDPRIVALVVDNAMDDNTLRQALAERFAGKRVFWLRGSDRIRDRLANPKPFRIQPDESIVDYLDGTDGEAQVYPEFVNINMTNRCNYSCFFCDLTIFGDNPDLPIEKVYSLKRLIRKVGIVDLTSLGEALLHPQIKEAIRFITANNQKNGIALTTTGMLLTEEITRLLSKRLYQLTISMNASTPETYRRDMGSKKWEKVLENLRVARKILPRDKMTLSFVMHGDNLDEVEDFVRIAGELDVWHARLVGMVVQKPEFVRRSLWFHKERAKEVVQKARQLGKELGVIVSDMYETVQEKSASGETTCIMPTYGSYILLNGDVMPCCYSRPQTMGSVHDEGGFDAVWNGKKYRRLRSSLYFKQCETCVVFQEPGTDSLERHFDGEVREDVRKVLPLITVAVYNPESPNALSAAVAQLKRQTYPFWEAVLVLDPGASDATKAAAEELCRSNEQIRWMKSTHERGARPIFAEGLTEARGELFCWMNAAKPFGPMRLEAYLKTFDRLDGSSVMAYEAPAAGAALDLTRAVFRTNGVGQASKFDPYTPEPATCVAASFTGEGC
jgi:MoaA/NifB/PqqE/SkfB family radical SAM enzyme